MAGGSGRRMEAHESPDSPGRDGTPAAKGAWDSSLDGGLASRREPAAPGRRDRAADAAAARVTGRDASFRSAGASFGPDRSTAGAARFSAARGARAFTGRSHASAGVARARGSGEGVQGARAVRAGRRLRGDAAIRSSGASTARAKGETGSALERGSEAEPESLGLGSSARDLLLGSVVHVVGVHLTGADRDGEVVLLGWDRTVVVIRIGAGRVVALVEIQHVEAILPQLGIEIAPHAVALLAGRRVGEEQPEVVLANPRLQQTRSLQTARGPVDLEVEPTHAHGAPPVSPRGEDDRRVRFRIGMERRDDVVGEIGREILDALVLLEPRALGIEHDDRRIALVREPEREAARLDACRRQGRRRHRRILDLEARTAIERLDVEGVPHDRDAEMMRFDAGVLDAHVIAGSTSEGQRGALIEVA